LIDRGFSDPLRGIPQFYSGNADTDLEAQNVYSSAYSHHPMLMNKIHQSVCGFRAGAFVVVTQYLR
jgi:hypothetical protein